MHTVHHGFKHHIRYSDLSAYILDVGHVFVSVGHLYSDSYMTAISGLSLARSCKGRLVSDLRCYRQHPPFQGGLGT